MSLKHNAQKSADAAIALSTAFSPEAQIQEAEAHLGFVEPSELDAEDSELLKTALDPSCPQTDRLAATIRLALHLQYDFGVKRAQQGLETP